MANYRNPNGYGSVTKLSGRRRNPYVARKTVGWDDRAYPIYAVIGYYPSRKDAMMALAAYNLKPYDIDLAKITFKELYEKWAETELPKCGRSLAAAHRASFKYCKALYDLPYKDIRKFQMQKCIDDCQKSYGTQNNIRNLFSTLDKFAFDNDIISKCYSTNLTIKDAETQRERTLFTNEEVQLLHKHQGEPFVDETLFLLYTGCRYSEMLLMENANIDLEQRIMRGGVKTASGKNRVIPIHSKLLPIIKAHYSDSKYLFDYPRSEKSKDPQKALETWFYAHWREYMKSLGLNHTTHDCRHTFRSKLDGYDKVAIDRIMGHKTEDIGEKVYTHKTIEQLKNVIEKLSYTV